MSEKTTTPLPLPETLKPQYWLIWLGLGLLKLISLLPYTMQCQIGKGIGRLLFVLANKRRKIAETNINRCLPALSETKRATILKQLFDQLGMMITDTSYSWWASPEKLHKIGKITDIENLMAPLKEGKGVILLTGHMTTLDIGGVIISEVLSQTPYPMRVMYKRNRNVLIEAIVQRGRERFPDEIFSHKDMRAFIRGLKKGLPTWYAPDQDFGSSKTVFADFFGIQTASLTTLSKIASKTQCSIVPYYSFRDRATGMIECKILPAINDFPGDDEIQDTTRINNILEDFIRLYPEQYLWVHRRFKTRPPGEADFYLDPSN